MKKVLYGILSVAILFSFTPGAQAEDTMLWSTSVGYSGIKVNSGTDIQSIPMYARLHDLKLSIPRTNPDILVFSLRFDGRFDATPLGADKKRNLSFRLYGPSINCPYNNSCSTYIYVSGPDFFAGKYPTSPATQTVSVYNLGKIPTDPDKLTETACPAPWWIDNSDPQYGAISYQLSINCLGIPADFYAYGASGADIGVQPIPFNFTTPANITNPFWQLAASAYKANGGASTVGKPYIKKTTSINCIKGKTTKKVSGLDPICPKGYKKK